MTSFDISESAASHIFIQYSSPLAGHYSVNAGGMRDPIRLGKAHLKFLAGEFVAQGNIVTKGLIENIAEKMCFTSIDQAFILWGLASAVIFSMAQFSLLSWTTQAVIDAAITGACITSTAGLTWQIAKAENLRWIIFLWAVLMAGWHGAYGLRYILWRRFCFNQSLSPMVRTVHGRLHPHGR